MIEITRIQIKVPIEVDDHKARINLKKLIAEILKVNVTDIEMVFNEKEK